MNKRLAALVSLSHKVVAYIPATINVDREIDNAQYVERMAAIMSDAFGGATASDVNGYWKSENGKLVKEKTTMVFAFADNLDNLDPVLDYITELKTELNQEAMALEIDGRMWFI